MAADTLSHTLDALLKLAASDRAELAMALWDSLTDAEHDAEIYLFDDQHAELRRRVAEHDAAPSTAEPWDEVRERLGNRGSRKS